jgi:hypothetical protein
MPDYTLEDQLRCVLRELAMRKRVYPKWVRDGRMTQAAATHELGCMQAVHDTIERMRNA